MGTEAGKDTFRKHFERLGISCSRTLANWLGVEDANILKVYLRWRYFECAKCVGVCWLVCVWCGSITCDR